MYVTGEEETNYVRMSPTTNTKREQRLGGTRARERNVANVTTKSFPNPKEKNKKLEESDDSSNDSDACKWGLGGWSSLIRPPCIRTGGLLSLFVGGRYWRRGDGGS